MQRIAIILLGLASLVAGGVILDRGRVGLNGQIGLGLQTIQGLQGGGVGGGIGIGSGIGQTSMTREELLRQKFILDILHQVYQPLQLQELLILDDPITVANEDLYLRPLTREMLMVLDMIRNEQMLGKQTVCRITNDVHMQQMLGLYRLLVNARDFETFKRLVVHARQNINTEMFVNTLILALGERSDTEMLIVPALPEVLAQIYHQDQVIEQVNQLDTAHSSIRPQLMDIVGLGRQNRLLNSRLADQQQQQQGGFLGLLDRSQLWMPWREFHRQLAWRKMMLHGRGPGMFGGNVVQQQQQQGQSQVDKLEVPLAGSGLLSQDVGLKAYVNILIDELIVNQDNIRNSIQQQSIGLDGNLGGRGQINNQGGLGRNRAGGDDDDEDVQINAQQGIRLGGRGQTNNLGGLGRYGADNDDEINSQYGSGLGGRGQLNTVSGLARNRGVNDDEINSQYGSGLRGREQLNTLGGLGRNRGNNDDDDSQQGSILSGGRGNTLGGGGVNTDRLLYIGRRQRGNDELNSNNIVGRRIGVDTDEIQGNGVRRLGQDIDEDLNDSRNGNAGRRQGLNIDYEHAMDRNRVMLGGRRQGLIRDQSQSQNIQDNDDLLIGAGRRGFQNRGQQTNQQDLQRNQDQLGRRNLQEQENGVNTVSVNDARLLFVGRRRKDPNNVETISGGGRNIQDDDNDDIISGGRRVSKEGKNEERQKNRYNNDDDDDSLYGRGRVNSERYINVNRRGMLWNQNNDDDDDLPWNRQQGKYVNFRGNRRQQQIDEDELYRNLNMRQGQGLGIGRGMGLAQRQPWDNEQDLMWNQGVNDERLLQQSNRYKLNNVEEGRRVSGRQQNLDDDDEEDLWQTGKQRGNSQTGSGRGQQQQTNWQRNTWDANRRGNQDNDNDRSENRGTSGRRYRRSLIDQPQNIRNEDSVTGKLLLHTLQQLVARLNVERIALGQPQLIDDSQNNLAHQVNSLEEHLSISPNDIRGIDGHTVQKIEEILQRIDNVLEQRIGDISVMSYNQKVNEIGLLLAGQMKEIGLIQLLGEILQQGTVQQQHRKGQVANIIENQAAQILLAGIVKVIDNKVQKVYRTRKEFISTLEGVTIHDVDVDQLQTYLEYDEIDLSNLLKNNLDQSREVVGRVPRLNHKNFRILVDVTSDRQQQVVVRNLLVPKVDGQGNKIPLQERRQNVIVLDITTAQLQPGHNILKLRSNDITLTARDTTPLTQIYQQVMQALNGNIALPRDLLAGQTNLLPHRLLLPRGRLNGLPMQLITVITRVQGNAGIRGLPNQGLSSALDILLLDHLPLSYPLHCDLTDLDGVVNMANLMVKDVKIYHDDNIQVPLTHVY